MLRQAFLFLSRNKGLRRWMETSSFAEGLTSRFVAGRSLDDVLRVTRKLHNEQILVTLDQLGENVNTVGEASESRRQMEVALEEIQKSGLPTTISIKLTQFGLDLSEELCFRNVEALVRSASEIGSRVEVDMESTEYTDRTLRIVESLHQQYQCMRAVLQAYLFRTEKDARRVSGIGLPVRLCKGAYNEPPTLAWPDKAKVDERFLELACLLLDEGTYPAIATHDPAMIAGVLDHVQKKNLPKDSFEFQMLYGIRRDLQKQLVNQGYRLRLYVPYGDAWYPYFMRRLAERPANVFFLARNLLRA